MVIQATGSSQECKWCRLLTWWWCSSKCSNKWCNLCSNRTAEALEEEVVIEEICKGESTHRIEETTINSDIKTRVRKIITTNKGIRIETKWTRDRTWTKVGIWTLTRVWIWTITRAWIWTLICRIWIRRCNNKCLWKVLVRNHNNNQM